MSPKASTEPSPSGEVTMRYPQGDLAILSAEIYTPVLPFPRSIRSETAKKAPPPSGASASEDTPRKRQKVQPSEDVSEREEEEKKRARGRPRLDVKDETAADRRRTQIRLAQRAYRNRKENAIQTLEKKVQELKDTNEEMSNVFMQLYDFAVSTGALDRIPEFGHRLRMTTEKFLALARRASEDAAKGDEAAAGSGESQPTGAENPNDHGRSSSPEPVNGTSPPSTEIANPKPQPLLYGGFTITHEPMTEADVFADFTSTFMPPPTTSAMELEIITQPTLENASFPFGTAPEFDFGSFSNPSPYTSIPLPRTYTSQEATFGRRLQRFAVERALVLISMPNPPPERFQRVFGFCLLMESREQIHTRLRRAVGRNIEEGLSNWQYPFYNLGGAGTHFNGDNTGRGIDILKPQNTAGFSTGPFTADITNVQDNALGKDMRITLPGLKGDFFDCDEVELYLRHRGVTIPPGADHVTVEIDPTGFSETPTTNRFSSTTAAGYSSMTVTSDNNSNNNTNRGNSHSPASSADSGAPTTTSQPQQPNGTSWALAQSSSLVDPILSGVFSGSSSNSYMATTATAHSTSDFSDSTTLLGLGSTSTTPRRETVMVDVNLLITKLTELATCLGRAPGFRHADINNAFWKSARMIPT